MRASINWLREFVSFPHTPAEIAEALTMAGLEVEGRERYEDDDILEISVTPNRPDCLSIIGIAREISAILGLPFKEASFSLQKEEGEGPSIQIEDPALCYRYVSRIVRGVKIKPSPGWIAKRLESHGFRPANNIVDITNYVLLEMGHPLHAFDLNKLSGGRIVVKTAGSGKEFATLDNEKRLLNREMLLIWDAEKPVAIAGIMGGINSEVTDSTVDILLESAYFLPASIRKTSKTLNLGTEASYRFERGADINRVSAALDRAAQLILDFAGGKTTRITDIYPKTISTQRISVNFRKINEMLGLAIPADKVKKILTTLGLEFRTEGEGLSVIPPGFRHDLQRDVDIIEEIARLYGYNKIPSTMPKITMQSVKNTHWKWINNIKDLMIGAGFSEAINYSFINSNVLDKLKLKEDDLRRKLIKIRNPLRQEEEALRTTLLPSLLENVRLNVSRGERSLRLFEISRTFIHSGKNLPDETLRLSAVQLNDKRSDLWHAGHEGFYELKGVAENLFYALKIKKPAFSQGGGSFSAEPYLHPGKSCAIAINGHAVGSIGTLHPVVAENFDVEPEINILELDLDKVFSLSTAKIMYKPLPRHPYVERDIAVIVSRDVTADEVEEIIKNVDSELIESVKLFDIYTGKPIPNDKKSLAFSIRYRAENRTLTDSEVNGLHSKIISRLEDSLKAELRS